MYGERWARGDSEPKRRNDKSDLGRACITILTFEGHQGQCARAPEAMHNSALMLWGIKAKSTHTVAIASMAFSVIQALFWVSMPTYL